MQHLAEHPQTLRRIGCVGLAPVRNQRAVFGANASDYSDEQIVQAEAAVAAAGKSSYVVAQAPYRYYRVKIKSTVADTPGTATVVGIAKAG